MRTAVTGMGSPAFTLVGTDRVAAKDFSALWISLFCSAYVSFALCADSTDKHGLAI